MRTIQVLLALLLVLGALPPAHAQAAGAMILDDPSGDLKTYVAGQAQGPPGGRFASADMTSLSVEESQDDIILHLGVANLGASPEAPGFESTQYAVDFAHGHMGYRVLFARQVADPTGQAQYSGRAYVYDPTRADYSQLERVVVSGDAPTNTMTATVPRMLLLDEHGSAPFPSRSLTDFHAVSTAINFGNFKIATPAGGDQTIPQTEVIDMMPDSGVGTAVFPIKLGLTQTGNARLMAGIPVRASNGEATTFVFTVNATNLGPKQRFHLATPDAPATWQVDLPSDLVELPANSTVTLPILVSTPFAHQHGRLISFTLTMSGLDHPDDVGRVQLGIHYTQPPQPAGHHDTLYLHTAALDGDTTVSNAFATAFGFDPTHMYFNTLTADEDENDAKVPVGGQDFGFTQGGVPQQKYEWTIPLSPGLQMGLDFDLGRTGELKTSLDSVLPMPGATMSGRFVYTIPDGRNCGGRFARPGQQDRSCTTDDFLFGGGQHINAAVVGKSSPQDVGPNAKDILFTMPISGTQDGDYITFHPDATLVLQLNLTFTRADLFVGPKDMPKLSGGEMKMPLLEYHDPVNQVFSSLASLMILVQGEQQRMVNPGKTALYNLELMNHGKDDASYDLDLSGSGIAWARVLGDRHITVKAGTQQTLGIAVTAPAGATDGDKADLVLAAIDSKDPAARTLARLLTTVDTKAVHEDDTAMVPGLAAQLTHKKSPGIEPVVSLTVVALAALAMRRRRWT